MTGRHRPNRLIGSQKRETKMTGVLKSKTMGRDEVEGGNRLKTEGATSNNDGGGWRKKESVTKG